MQHKWVQVQIKNWKNFAGKSLTTGSLTPALTGLFFV